MTHQFHVLDVDPSLAIPPWVMLPSAGFSEVTAPELSIATEDITEGVSPFVYKAYGKASVGTITLRRGVSAFNSDFWRWITACLAGEKPLGDFANLQILPTPAKRRNLLIMHFTGISPAGLVAALSEGGSVLDKMKGSLLLAAGGTTTALAQGISQLTQGLVDIGITSIPGKVYMLFDALPVRYKVASDFDATSSEVSMEELDLEVLRFEEFALLA